MKDQEEIEILERVNRRLKKPEIAVVEEPMLSSKEVQEYLKISHMTLKRDVSLGRITPHKKGLSLVNWYKKSEVEALKKLREEIH